MIKAIKNTYVYLNEKLCDFFNNKLVNTLFIILATLFIASLFFVITRWTPIAGDDWGYALNGMSNNPIKMAFEFYMNWSGRFFSELWGFIVAPNKALWIILNTVLFVFIFVFSLLLSSPKKKYLLSSLLIIMLMLRVSNDLRMETYTWVMGGTYVVPLMLTLLYFWIIERKILYVKNTNKKWLIIPTSLICFYVGLTMENIAIVLIFAQLLFIAYYFYYYHKLNWLLVINTLISTFSFILMRLSPGSSARLIRDHYLWNQQGIIEKISGNIPNFMEYTFVANKYLILSLASILIVLSIKFILHNRRSKRSIFVFLGTGYLALVLLATSALKLVNDFNITFMEIFLDLDNYLLWLFWLIFMLVVFLLVYLVIDNIKIKQKILFYITIGGSANIVMLISPIFGARSSIYFVYFLIIATVLLFNELNLKNGWVMILISAFMIFSIYKITYTYIIKYRQVNQIQTERLDIIEYYQKNPDIKEVHIPRMPPYSVHGADIEIGDDYGFEIFKEYYKLAKDTIIIFEWKETYD